jgi:chemotaxis signal transduction protein
MSSLHVRVRVSGEDYAFPVDDVLEVAELGDFAPVPGATAALLGVCNLRGQVLPVVDLASVLGLPKADTPASIVVAESRGRTAALAVDAVAGVDQLPEAVEEADSPHLMGAALVDGALVGFVELESVLDAVQGPTPR